MKVLKKHLGLFFILTLFGINALFWFTATPLFEQPIESKIGQWQGANILLGFTIVFFLATKNRLVVFLFNGLEKSYKYHRVIAMLSLLLVFIHASLSHLVWQNFIPGLPFNARDMGALARNLFVALILIALMAKYIKYEHWRFIHRLMIFPYLFASYHAFTLSSYPLLNFSPLSIWMIFMISVGSVSSLYMIFIYRKVSFPYNGKIVKVTHLTDAVTEIQVELDKPYTFETGQFTFIKIKMKPFNNVPHPFSLSGSSEDKILFTIKAIGDYTEDIYKKLRENTKIAIGKPLGHMTFDTHSNTQVWIAGGIGITPFLSHMRSLKEPTQTIRLYYAVNEKKEAVHLELLEALSKKPSFSYKLVEAKTEGFLTVDKIDLSGNPDILMCGPRPMAVSLAKSLKKAAPNARLTYEAFSFTGTFVEDIVRNIKKVIQKFKKQKSN
ncbi:MAG: ferric reductase-like transmembrane domain-containing protein [Candidatus Izemoplasmataceae bacterium]